MQAISSCDTRRVYRMVDRSVWDRAMRRSRAWLAESAGFNAGAPHLVHFFLDRI